MTSAASPTRPRASTITARFRTRCRSCGATIAVGEQIVWSRLEGARHPQCADEELASVQATFNGPTWHISRGAGYGGGPYLVESVLRLHPWERAGRGAPELVVVLRATKHYYHEDGLSFGVGDESGYLYQATVRAATNAETAPLIEAEEQRERRRAAQADLEAVVLEVARDGDYLPGSHVPEGRKIIVREITIYGTGQWLVLGDEWIWAVTNNGMDGDNWSANNVRTGGAGAIGHRVAATEALRQRIEDADGRRA